MRVIILSITSLSLLPVGEYKIRGEIENQFCVRPDGARNCQPEVMRISPASLFLTLTLVQRLPIPHSLLLTGYPLAHGPECREETVMIRSCGLVAQASQRQGVDILEADVGSEVALGVGVCVSAVRAMLWWNS